jgi:hypothetical protein
MCSSVQLNKNGSHEFLTLVRISLVVQLKMTIACSLKKPQLKAGYDYSWKLEKTSWQLERTTVGSWKRL